MVRVYLGLGTNLGDREANLRGAVGYLQESGWLAVGRVSSIYETEPVGYPDQADFLNTVLAGDTDCSPRQLLTELKAAEAGLGREPGPRWGPRRIDLDILLYGDLTVTAPDLIIPHPRLRERGFVVVPLAEIVPDLVLPGGEAVADLAAQPLLTVGVKWWKAWDGGGGPGDILDSPRGNS